MLVGLSSLRYIMHLKKNSTFIVVAAAALAPVTPAVVTRTMCYWGARSLWVTCHSIMFLRPWWMKAAGSHVHRLALTCPIITAGKEIYATSPLTPSSQCSGFSVGCFKWCPPREMLPVHSHRGFRGISHSFSCCELVIPFKKLYGTVAPLAAKTRVVTIRREGEIFRELTRVLHWT